MKTELMYLNIVVSFPVFNLAGPPADLERGLPGRLVVRNFEFELCLYAPFFSQNTFSMISKCTTSYYFLSPEGRTHCTNGVISTLIFLECFALEWNKISTQLSVSIY